MFSSGLFGIGCIVVVAPLVIALIAVVLKRTLGGPVVSLLTIACLMGGALVGVGATGMGFLTQYADLVEALTSFSHSPTVENQERVLDLVANSTLDRSDREMALSYVLERPTPDTRELMISRAETAPPKGRDVLQQGVAQLDEDIRGAAIVAGELKRRNMLTPMEFSFLDTRTQVLVEGYLPKLTENELEEFGLNTQDLESLERDKGRPRR